MQPSRHAPPIPGQPAHKKHANLVSYTVSSLSLASLQHQSSKTLTLGMAGRPRVRNPVVGCRPTRIVATLMQLKA